MARSVLYLGMQVLDSPKTGGEYGQLRNRKMLRAVFDNVDVVEIPKVGIMTHIINVLLGNGYGFTKNLNAVLEEHLYNNYDLVFIDSSSYGAYVAYFHERGMKTIVFCHNVEYDYYKAKLKSKRNIENYVLTWYIHRQEQLTMHYASRVITLNERDSKGLQSYYDREADLILPLFYENIGRSETKKINGGGEFLIFVGADFCANNEGIVWFIEKVSRYIDIDIHIAGGCCNAVAKVIDAKLYPNVKLMGFVDNLNTLYREASGVICPVFTGSGMKTKTVEALKFGKSVFGTSEAFEGIDANYEKIGGLCNTAEEFINAINKAKLTLFNEYSYNLFKDNFSTDAVYPRFEEFVDKMLRLQK